MNARRIGVLGGAALAAVPTAALAQAQANVMVRQVVRVVKTGKQESPQLDDAKVGAPVQPGERVRTAGRSFAALRFPDQSVLRLNELTEVVVTNPRKRDMRVLRGTVIADFKAPGVISGGYAVAAVRGTHVEYTVDEANKTASVRCYSGRVFVSAPDNPIVAGGATTLTATTLTDSNLVDNETEYRGGELRFTDGPFSGQVRDITAFDRRTGTVTFSPALPVGGSCQGGEAVNGYLLLQKKGRSIVELRDNMGTFVNIGREPSQPRSVPSEKFAGLQQKPFAQALDEGSSTTTVYNGSNSHQNVQLDSVGERQAVAAAVAQTLPPEAGGGPLDCLFGNTGRAGRRGRAMRRFGTANLRAMMASQLPTRQPGQPADPGPTTPEQRALPGNVAVPTSADISEKVAFRFEPFAIAGTDADVLGGRVRLQASSGDAYAEVGYRYASINERPNHQLSEGFLVMRGDYGDFTVGRQHLFLRLANNTNVGTLLGLETSDALSWQLPLKKGYKQTVGYIWDTQPLASGALNGSVDTGFHAGFARGQAPVWRGNVGYALMAPSDGSRNVGWSLDAAQTIVKNVVDIYGEFGRDTRNNELSHIGLYLPWFYQKAKLDVFVEYHNRRTVDERTTFRVRREFGYGLMLVGFLDRVPGDTYSAGAGVLWSKKFK